MPTDHRAPCLIESLESRRLLSVVLGNLNGDATGDGSDTAINQPLDNTSGGGDTPTTDANGDGVQVIYYGGINHGGHKGSHHAGHSSQSAQQSGGGIWTGLTAARNRH